MIRSLYTSATGMKANQLYIDNISNNLANVNTTGFKKSKLEFQELLYQTIVEPGSGALDGAKSPAGLQLGLGVRSAANQRIFGQGNLQETKNSFDMAITGTGFLQVQLPSGEVGYTRDGSFKISNDGTLVTSSGFPLEPQISVPDGASDIQIDAQGRVMVFLSDSGTSEEIGQIELAKFLNEGGLKSLGNNLYQISPASGDPEAGTPGTNGLGTLAQGYLEASNVELVEEMVNMIVAQRAYEVSAKAIQTSDSMLQLANQLKG
ncbi:MAG: flagellar basal-body rod protein FlgG [Fibrobacterota bacterium]|nr:flagellar basal-body rod protein FlgG [Fibrobacterota bacterium]